MRIKILGARAAGLAALLLATMASSAAAATASADVGSNVGSWLTGLGQDVLIPVAGLFGIGALFRRDIGHALVIALIAVIAGVFVYDTKGATQMIHAVANTLTK